jgi:hypothetical protein
MAKLLMIVTGEAFYEMSDEQRAAISRQLRRHLQMLLDGESLALIMPKDTKIQLFKIEEDGVEELTNGIWRLLNMPLTINGISPRPITFVGQDALAGGWPERHGDVTLALQAGTAPDYQQPGAFRDELGFCQFNDGGFFLDPGNVVGDYTIEEAKDDQTPDENP